MLPRLRILNRYFTGSATVVDNASAAAAAAAAAVAGCLGYAAGTGRESGTVYKPSVLL